MERTVAAGVDDRDLEAGPLAVEDVQYAGRAVADRQGKLLQQVLTRAIGNVDTEEVVVRAVAPAVTGIDEHGGVAGLDLLDEFADRGLHIDDPEVVAILDREALFAQQVRVALRVGPRLPQGVDVLIGVVADDKRELLFGERRPPEAKPRQQHRNPNSHERLLSSRPRYGLPHTAGKSRGLPADGSGRLPKNSIAISLS